jgi:GrpB-like predicted nucleotidyltransferase (UPF0157 family)
MNDGRLLLKIGKPKEGVLMYPITLYNPPPVACHPYDPQAPEVASLLNDLIRSRLPDVEVEHIGSTSVSGCAGKGFIDLMVLYREGSLEEAKAGLAALGFQRQSSRDPFPEDRPMRVGSFTYKRNEYQVHAHVIDVNSTEANEFRTFRDRLRQDVQLREAYIAEKRRILEAGLSDHVDYCIEKGAFVEKIIASDS